MLLCLNNPQFKNKRYNLLGLFFITIMIMLSNEIIRNIYYFLDLTPHHIFDRTLQYVLANCIYLIPLVKIFPAGTQWFILENIFGDTTTNILTPLFTVYFMCRHVTIPDIFQSCLIIENKTPVEIPLPIF